MDKALQNGLLKWLEQYRAATGEQKQWLGAQVEAHAPLLNGVADQVWVDELYSNMRTATPIAMVRRQADLAYAETQAMILEPK